MKKLNLALKLVVLAVFAGGLGLAGNGLNCEVRAMDNFGIRFLNFQRIDDLQKAIRCSNFFDLYEKLKEGVKNNTLSSNSRKTALTQCVDTLNVMTKFQKNICDIDRADSGELTEFQLKKIIAMKDDLDKNYRNFYKLYQVLFFGFSVDNITSETDNKIVEDKVKDENDRKINELEKLIGNFNSNVSQKKIENVLDSLELIDNEIGKVDENQLDSDQKIRFEKIRCNFEKIKDDFIEKGKEGGEHFLNNLFFTFEFCRKAGV